MEIIHGSDDNFDTLINDELVLVDFYATWCGPCKMLGPVLEALNSERANVKIVKVDVDKNEKLAKRYGIMSVPTLMLFGNGKLIDTRNGFMPLEQLKEWINC